METTRARQFLQSLVQGVDPVTGEEIVANSVLQQADVLRAILCGVSALDAQAGREERRAKLPANSRAPWTAEEEAKLVAEFTSGAAVAEMAVAHQRTVQAIGARLVKLGLMQPGEIAGLPPKN